MAPGPSEQSIFSWNKIFAGPRTSDPAYTPPLNGPVCTMLWQQMSESHKALYEDDITENTADDHDSIQAQIAGQTEYRFGEVNMAQMQLQY